MKIIKILLGTIAGLYSLAQAVNFVYVMITGPNDDYQFTRLTATGGISVITFVIAFALFKSALKKKEEIKEGNVEPAD